MVRRLVVLGALAGLFALASCGSAVAAPADLDRSFGGDGIVEVEGPAGTAFPAEAGAQMAIGPKDEIFVLYSRYPACEPPFGCTIELTVARYDANGNRDMSFGAGPQVVVQQDAFSRSFDLAVGPDGKPVIAAIDEPTERLVIARLDASGRLDGTFGSGGFAPEPLEAALTPPPTVAVQRDGKVVVSLAGGKVDGGEELRVARFQSDGARDLGFGSGGETRIVEPTQTRPAGLLLDPGGSISVAGPLCCIGGTPFFGDGFSLARFLPSGQPDSSFAGTGQLLFPTPGADGGVEAVALARDGGMVVVFEEGTEARSVVDNMIKLTPTGALDGAFGHQGRLHLFPRVGTSDVSALAVDARSRLVGVGWEGKIALFRLHPNGSADRTFNGGQRVLVPYGNGGVTSYSIGIQSSGRIVVLGEVGCCGNRQGFALIGLHGGTDRTRCLGHRATIVGTGKADEIFGTRHRDVIAALGGNDKVLGLGGPDVICGGKGKDKLFGGPGRDEVKP